MQVHGLPVEFVRSCVELNHDVDRSNILMSTQVLATHREEPPICAVPNQHTLARARPATRCGDTKVRDCVEINQCVGCTRQFFTKSFLGDDAADLAPSSSPMPIDAIGAGIMKMAWRSKDDSARTRRKI